MAVPNDNNTYTTKQWQKPFIYVYLSIKTRVKNVTEISVEGGADALFLFL